MSAWRRKAMELLPRLKPEIEASLDRLDLWLELSVAFKNAYRATPPDEGIIEGMYAYADWCWRESRDEASAQKAWYYFYDDLADTRETRRDIRKRLTPEQIREFWPAFIYGKKPGEIEELERELLLGLPRKDELPYKDVTAARHERKKRKHESM